MISLTRGDEHRSPSNNLKVFVIVTQDLRACSIPTSLDINLRFVSTEKHWSLVQ